MSQIAARGADLMATSLSVSTSPLELGAADFASAGAVPADATARPASTASASPITTPGTVAVSVAATNPEATNVASAPAVASPASATTTSDATSTGAASATRPPAVPSAPTAYASASFVKPVTATSSAHVGAPAPFAKSPSTAGSIGGAVFALIVVIGLILALAWLAKRMPGLAGNSNPALRIVGSLQLGPRERVVVVAVGDTQLLLGVGAGGTRTLHTLAAPLPVVAPTTPAFAQLLAQHFGKKA